MFIFYASIQLEQMNKHNKMPFECEEWVFREGITKSEGKMVML